MSILIKGMEMPKSCRECPLLYVTSICGGFKDCPLQPLVRCENCKHCRKEDEYEYWCYGLCSPARLVRKDDFCSYGCKNE